MSKADDIIKVMQGWIGYSEVNGKHKQIIDIYNNHKPLAQGYKVKYTDEWCDTTVSAAAIKAGVVDLIGTECGVERHIQIFKNKGIWQEDGRIKPIPGDIIVYNWDDTTQPNDGWADHIGIVEKVEGNKITVIEGNIKQAVGRRTVTVGQGFIRGYAQPKYQTKEDKVTKINFDIHGTLLEVDGIFQNDTNYIPVRLLERLGLKVEWKNRTVVVTYKD